MSTRAVYTFKDGWDSYHVYKHCDGYPSGAAHFIEKAFKQFNESFDGNPRQFEASELSTRFIVANKDRFGGIYLSKGYAHHGDLEYRYEIESGGTDGVVIRAYRVPFDSAEREVLIFSGSLAQMLEWVKAKAA